MRCRLVDSLERPEEAGKVILVGGPDVLTYRQIAVLAAGAAGVTRPRCAGSRAEATQQYCLMMPDHTFVDLRQAPLIALRVRTVPKGLRQACGQ